MCFECVGYMSMSSLYFLLHVTEFAEVGFDTTLSSVDSSGGQRKSKTLGMVFVVAGI